MCNNCENCYNTSLFTFIASMITAIGIAGLFFASVFRGIIILVFITLALGLIGLLYIILTLFCKDKDKCYCLKKSSLVPAVIGALITSIIALFGGTLVTASEAVGLFVIALLFFMVFLLIKYFFWFVSLFCKKCDYCSTEKYND